MIRYNLEDRAVLLEAYPLRTKLILFAVNLAIVGFLVGGVEWASRLYQTKRLGPGSQNPQTLRDRWSGWRNNPRFGRVDIQHTPEGFRRSKPVTKIKPFGTTRIFFLGGSTAYGCEGLLTSVDANWVRLPNNQLIDFYLEQKLEAHFPGRRFEVINAATNMYRLHQTEAAIRSRLLEYQPDLIVSLDGHNDLSGLILNRRDTYNPYVETSDTREFELLANPDSFQALLFQFHTWLRNQSAFYSMLQGRMNRMGNSTFVLPNGPERKFTQPVARETLTPEEQNRASLRESQVGYLAKASRRIAAILREEKVPVLFAFQPELTLSGKKLAGSEPALKDYFGKLSGPYEIHLWERLSPLARAEMTSDSARGEYAFEDLTHALDAESGQMFTDYCHLTPRGNEVVADKLLPVIEKLLAANVAPNAKP